MLFLLYLELLLEIVQEAPAGRVTFSKEQFLRVVGYYLSMRGSEGLDTSWIHFASVWRVGKGCGHAGLRPWVLQRASEGLSIHRW